MQVLGTPFAQVVTVTHRIPPGGSVVQVPAVVPAPWRHADLDAAERLGQVEEPGEVHLSEMVDAHPGDRLYRGDLERLARPVSPQVTLTLLHGRAVGLAKRLVIGEVVGLVDLPAGDPEVGGM